MDAILRIEAALAAGPIEGPWIGAGPSFGASMPKYIDEVLVDREGDEDDTYTVCQCPTGLRDDPESNVTMSYIAEVNPAAIREVLQTLASKEAELVRLREALIGYMVAVELMNTAMKDGINVHGAMGGLIAATDAANDAITQPPKEPT